MPTFNKAAKWFRRLVGRGANRDIRPEVLPDSLYADGSNIRPASISGNSGGIEAVLGEILKYAANSPGLEGYRCIGARQVNGKLIEFWAQEDEPSIVRIDGVIVAQSDNIPYTFDRPLVMAVVEKCSDGFVYPVDGRSPPLFWDIAALLQAEANDEDTYFENYNTDINAVGLSAPPEPTRHKGNPDVGNGLPPGQYSYALRWEAPTGDKSNIGPESPLISVGLQQDSQWTDTAFPGSRTTGGVSDTTTPTRWGIALEFNVDNTQGYSFVEIIRRRFNDGQGLNGPGIQEIVARIPIIPGEFRTVSFVDPVDSNFLADVTPEEENERQIDILGPKAVEYADNRLTYANFQTTPLVTDITFELNGDGQAFVPITMPVTTQVDGTDLNSGYTDPVNDTYMKSYRRGERYGLALQPWGPKLDKPYAVPIPGGDDYQFPNRRDRKTGDSLAFSGSPAYAVTTDNQSASPVGATFEAFEQGFFQKLFRYVNVIAPPYVTVTGYQPWRPVAPDDSSSGSWQLRPVSGRIPFTGVVWPDAGEVWNPRYNALGTLIYGVDVPENVKAFTVVRTPPAGRVVCQGLATYRLSNSFGGGIAGKITNELAFHSRDLFNGSVPQNVLEDIVNNPTNYQIQFVSPLGFYTEYYGYDLIGGAVARGVDQLSYAGIQYDTGQVNTGDVDPQGYQVAPGDAPFNNYVGWGAWRNQQPPNGQAPNPGPTDTDYSYWNETGKDGNSQMVLTGAAITPDGRSRYLGLFVDNFVYSPGTATTLGSGNSSSTEVRNFHQPWYVVNIIRNGAEVPEGTGQYVNTGVTIKMRSCIGVSTGSTTQTYKLVNERWEDVLGYFASDYRYTYVSQTGLPDQAWLCMTNNDAIDPTTILAAIDADGFWVAPDGTQVYGLYEVNRVGSEYFVVFGTWQGVPIPAPPTASRIIVKYNKLAPIRAYGGDCTIYPSINAQHDRKFLTDQDQSSYPEQERVFPIGGLPLPFQGFVKADTYLLPSTSQALQDDTAVVVQSIRQWCVLYDVESPTHPAFDLWGPPNTAGAPRGGYMIRPYDYSNGTSGFWTQWTLDYGAWDPWYNYGGIRFPWVDAEYNRDYWKQPNISSIGIPETGFVDRTDYCAALIASLERDPQLENNPALRTFLASNIKMISEENGEIKYIASLLGGSGQNMYAITQSGLCRILTNKNILTSVSGAEIATQAITNYWGDEMWITREVGSPDQMWRLIARGYAPAGQSYADSLFWVDRNSVYRLTGDTIVDIARDKYLSQLKDPMKDFPADYSGQATAFFNEKYNEVWFSFGAPSDRASTVFVYSAQTGEWIGQFTYKFDAYTMLGADAIGLRSMETYDLDEGFTISGETRRASITVPIVGDMGILKEFTRWAVTGSRPDEVEILDKDYNVICRQNEAIAALVNPSQSQYWVLRYSKGWEQWAAAVLESVNPNRPRPQDEFFYLRCTWFTEGEKQSVGLQAGYQNIK